MGLRKLMEPAKDRIPEKEYNEIRDEQGNLIEKVTDRAARAIKKLKDEEIELEI
ncbi:hypothetical protein ES705_43681 [subsurface metagenome]